MSEEEKEIAEEAKLMRDSAKEFIKDMKGLIKVKIFTDVYHVWNCYWPIIQRKMII